MSTDLPDIDLPALSIEPARVASEAPPRRRRLLEAALEAADGADENGPACLTIVRQAIEADLFRTAQRAITLCDEPDYVGWAAFELFRTPRSWADVEESFLSETADRLQAAPDSEFGGGEREQGLAATGAMYLFFGQPAMAKKVWAAGRDIQHLDEALAEMLQALVEFDGMLIDEAVAASDIIRTGAERAELLAILASRV